MVRHNNVHRIEWPLGVITVIYPDERGVIRTAEVEECGKRSLRPVSYLVLLELDCRHDDDALCLCPRDPQGSEEDDDDDDEEDAAIATNEDSNYSLRTKEVQMYQPMLRDRSFFPTRHMQSFHHASGSS